MYMRGRNMKNVNDKVIAVMLFMLAFVLCLCIRAHGQQFEYKGVYSLKSIFTNYCKDCFLELPPDYLNSEVVLSVSTDDSTKLFKALQTSSRALGWNLTRGQRGQFKAEPIENVGMLVYISCMDNQPKNVPKYLYTASIESDRRLCQQRDSLALIAHDRAHRDSVRADSLAHLPPLAFSNYQLRYYSYSKSFTDRMGVEWGTLLASGNLHNRLDLFDDWRLVATSSNDTAFTERSLLFSVDSSLNVDWGSEEQTLKQTFVNDGVTTQDYEWRKYGMIVKIKRDGQRVRMDYIFRDKENAVSVLQGSVIGNEGDTLRLYGTYTAKRYVTSGVPFLSSIPVLGNLFKVENEYIDNRAFELYLLPQIKAVQDVKRKDSPIVQTDRKTATDTTAAVTDGGEVVVR